MLSTIGIGITYTETVTAQTNNNMTSGSTQNQTDEFEVLITGSDQPTTNDTTPLGSSVGEAISEDVTISLANASMIAERDVGPNSLTKEARISVWNDGTMVYFALV